jgi:hypothetical protein
MRDAATQHGSVETMLTAKTTSLNVSLPEPMKAFIERGGEARAVQYAE